MGAAGTAAESGSTTREFYEFVLPPVDVRVGPSGTTVDIDVPGFGRRDIKLSLSGDLLTIRAEKCGEGGGPEEEGEGAVRLQRPRRLDKTVRLPAGAGGGGAGACTARYADGVLTVVIPAAASGGGKGGAGGAHGPAAA